MTKKLTHLLNNTEGVAAVEFALIAPTLIFLLIGAYDYATFMNTTMKIENTARSAAEYLSVGGSGENINDDVLLPSNLGLTEETVEDVDFLAEYKCECGGGIEIECTATCTPEDGGEEDENPTYKRRYLEVTMSMDHTPVLNYPGIPRTMTLAGHVRLQIE